MWSKVQLAPRSARSCSSARPSRGSSAGLGRRHNYAGHATRPHGLIVTDQRGQGRISSWGHEPVAGGRTRDLGHPVHAASSRSMPTNGCRSVSPSPESRNGAPTSLLEDLLSRDVVVVLHYRGLADTERCVESLVKGSPGAQVLVVDNGSEDGALDHLVRRWPALATLQNGENLGFAGGMNTGLRWALERSYSSITILNNDTVVPPGTVSALVGTCSARDRCESGGALCGRNGSGVVRRRSGGSRHLPGATPGALRAGRTG